jgi:16S rRNA (guanine527-N7)-methyltransferase
MPSPIRIRYFKIAPILSVKRADRVSSAGATNQTGDASDSEHIERVLMEYNELANGVTVVTGFQMLGNLIPDLDVDHCIKALQKFGDTISEWNDYAHLVSSGDLRQEGAHVVDSFSLAPIVASALQSDGGLLDIGSGAGFPAIVLKIVLPGLRVVLMERDRKKAAFLRKTVGMLGLRDVKVVNGSFPTAVPDGYFGAITARAVETPSVILPAIGRFLTPERCFISQSPSGDEYFGDGFDIEVVDDDWDRLGLRRGSVRVVRVSR